MEFIDLFSRVPLHIKKGVIGLGFSRLGGVSPKPFDTLNVGKATGDKPENVLANLKLIQEKTRVSSLVGVTQVHGTDFFHVERGDLRNGQEVEADGIFSRFTGVGLLIKTADCQPVSMFDPVKKVVANIHCGWRGSVGGILKRAVEELKHQYGSCPEDIWVGIGPSLGPCCGEFKGWKTLLPEWMWDFRLRPNHFDFWSISISQLVGAGVPLNQINCVRVCTMCNHNYFSYRREGITGRLANVVALLP